jgi:RNA-directed DNA polymerase
MKLTKEHTDYIRLKFSEIETTENLIDLINYAKSIIYPHRSNPKPILITSINFYSNSKIAKVRYLKFAIKKKSGGERIIKAPVSGLKLIQRCLNLIFNAVFTSHLNATGFVPGKNIVDNAKVHTGKNYVYNIDIKDFFPSVEFRRIKTVLTIPPFNLPDKVAFVIANLCCDEGSLPQGAPTSPTLTNIICQRLDRKLTGLSKRYGCYYTRYADDITFSSYHNIFQIKEKDSELFYSQFILDLNVILKEQNFLMNPTKTRLQKIGYRQEVTGLTVNEIVNVQKRYVKNIRAMLNNWESKGLKEAESIFRRCYFSDKGHIKRGNPDFTNVLFGKLEFLKMVRGSTDKVYNCYNDQLIRLSKNSTSISDIPFSLGDLLDLWEKEGLTSVMNNFYGEN